jgi:peptide chain release factor 2
MRAETQANVDAIRKSLKLLAQRMDWETAPHRLEEFNALIEARSVERSGQARKS